MRRIICETRLCTGCEACRQICPSEAVMMMPDDEGFLYPHVVEELCNNCGLCIRTCPVNKTLQAADAEEDALFSDSAVPDMETADAVVADDVRHIAYACYSLDEAVRDQSTSGGIFSQLALHILEEGGVVFGAGFDKDFRVRHAYARDDRELDGLRRSKYVQSDTGNTFCEAKAFLDEGRKVLYCGTPCQIAGLKAYLGKEYAGLLTCDLACHGVPSPKVWASYLEFIRSKYNSPIKAVSFRDKSTGWKTSSMRIEFENGSVYSDLVQREIFFIGFGKSIFNRLSCFDCLFRLQNTKADITLADFWGIEHLDKDELSDNRGVSLIITHTVAGEEAVKNIGSRIFCSEKPLDDAVKYNPRLISSVKEPEGRKRFFNDMKSGFDFDRLRAKYMDNTSLVYRTKRLLKRIMGRG